MYTFVPSLLASVNSEEINEGVIPDWRLIVPDRQTDRQLVIAGLWVRLFILTLRTPHPRYTCETISQYSHLSEDNENKLITTGTINS